MTVDLRAARTALAGLAVPADGQILSLSGLDPMDDVENDLTLVDLDGMFVPAAATIDGTTILVASDAVTKPTQARYAWLDNPKCNLQNGDGLPASPFRTAR